MLTPSLWNTFWCSSVVIEEEDNMAACSSGMSELSTLVGDCLSSLRSVEDSRGTADERVVGSEWRGFKFVDGTTVYYCRRQ